MAMIIDPYRFGGAAAPTWFTDYTADGVLLGVLDFENDRAHDVIAGTISGISANLTNLTKRGNSDADHIMRKFAGSGGATALRGTAAALPIWNITDGGLFCTGFGVVNELGDSHGLATGWSSDAGVVVTPDDQTAPDGVASDATKIEFDTTADRHYYDVLSTFTAGDDICFGTWIKKVAGTSTDCRLRIQELDTNEYLVTGSAITTTSTYEWVEVKGTDSTATGAFTCRFIIENGASVADHDIAVWCGYAGHYAANAASTGVPPYYKISTTDTTATVTLVDADWTLPAGWDNTALTVVMECSFGNRTTPTEYQARADDMCMALYDVANIGTADNRNGAWAFNFNQGRFFEIRHFISNGSNIDINLRTGYGPFNDAERRKVVFSAAVNDFRLDEYGDVGGAQTAVDDTSYTVVDTPNTLRMGNFAKDSTEKSFGGTGPVGYPVIVHSMAFYGDQISDADVSTEADR